MPPRIHPVRSTYPLLAARWREEDSGDAWIDWALEMMEAGYDSEHIVELAGSTPPLNAFELNGLKARALAEAGIDASDREQVLLEYAWYLADESLEGRLTYKDAIHKLIDLCRDLDYNDKLLAFYQLGDIYEDPVLYGYTDAALAAEAEHDLCAWVHAFEAGENA